MTARVRFRDPGNTLRTAARIRMRDASNTLRTINRIRMRDASNTLRTVYQYLSIVLSTTVATGSASGAASSGTVTSSNVTSTLSGGTAGFTYAWQYIDGDATIVPTSPTASASTFSAINVPDALGKIARYQLQVTDSTGAVAVSAPVEIQLYWIDTR